MQNLSLSALLATTVILSTSALANDVKAPKETLISLTDICTKAAAEEQIESGEAQQFVSDCVNAQLIEMGYQRQFSLAKTELTKDNL
ncbi:hypothetical protein L2735_10165 [Shewanella olleyana]|uniref:hypothetical protein n=1 Tax=Shewanella olleyana TaxID=135626 RepID=UPI00200DF98C|nr:hypothetical protein [Shewanella olleyana]MCL1067171.1 hypothetical protein [Shewanella olleyana]